MTTIQNYAKNILLKKPIKELGLNKELTKKILDNGITVTDKLIDFKHTKRKHTNNSDTSQIFKIENLNLVPMVGIGKALETRIKVKIIEVYSKIQMEIESFVDISKVPNCMFENYFLLTCKVLQISEKDIHKKSIDCEGVAVSLLTLNPKEIFVISSRFGLSGNGSKSPKEIANSLKISRKVVYSIEQRALQKLRRPSLIEPFRCNKKFFSVFTDPSSTIK